VTLIGVLACLTTASSIETTSTPPEESLMESPPPAATPTMTPALTDLSTPTPSPSPTPVWWTRHTLGGGGAQTGIAIDPTDTGVAYVTTDNGGIVKTTDGGATWLSANNDIGNRLLADIEMDPLDPDVLYVAAEVYSESPSWSDDPVTGELYRSQDGGDTWEVAYAEGMGTGDGRSFGIAQAPSTRNILIPYDPSDPGRYDADGDHLTDVIYVGGWDEDEAGTDKRGGIWKSTDEGATFTQLALNDKNIWVLRQNPGDPEILYAGTLGDGLFVSRDGGTTWQDWSDRIPVPMISDIAIVPNANTLYVAINALRSEYNEDEYADSRGIYKSTDGGASFFTVNSGLEDTSLNFEALILDRTDPSGQTLYTGPHKGGNRGIYKTTDGGATWGPMAFETANTPYWLDSFDNLWALEQAHDGTLFATTWREIYRYDPASRRWEIRANGLGNISVQSVAFEPGRDTIIYLGILDSPPWKSENRGMTWTSIGDGFTTTDGGMVANASDFAISPTNPQIVYATGIGPSGRYISAVNRSEDGGAHWEPITNGLPPTSTEDPTWQANAIAVSAHDPSVAYVALETTSGSAHIYKTTDGGDQWNELFTIEERPTDLALSATDPETVICVTGEAGIVYIGRDGGTQWQSSALNRGLIYAVDVFPSDPDRILVGVNVAGAFLTTDGGASWQRVFGETELQPFTTDIALSDFARARYWPTIRAVRFDPNDPDTLYIGHNPSIWMGVGVLKSTDAGQTWASLADRDFQMRSIHAFDLDPESHNLVVGSWEVYYYYAEGLILKSHYLPFVVRFASLP
jgi:photosystem II stability/assembly factor-like uncharacterized protein